MKNDKCDLCSLKVIFDQDSLEKERHIENFFDTLHKLQEDKIIEKGYARRIFKSIGSDGSGDRSEMCAVNSRFFISYNKDKKCPAFILNMRLSVPDALSLNASKKNIKLSFQINCLTWVLVVSTILLLFLGILPFIQNTTKPKQNSVIIEKHINFQTERNQENQGQRPIKKYP